MILQRNAEEGGREREGGGHELGQFAQTMAQSAKAEEAATTAMHLVECWETRGKMEEDERETGKMISGVPPPLARSLGRSLGLSERRSERRHAMQRYGGTMQQVARRRGKAAAAARNSFSPFCEL